VSTPKRKGTLFEGHAGVFDEFTTAYGPTPDSNGLAKYRERIRPGAFRAGLAEGREVEALVNHNVDHIIARRSNGTLKLWEDARGLAVRIDAAPIELTATLETLVARGDLGKMSFSYTLREGGTSWSRGADGIWTRNLTALDIYEVSIVTRPAYAGTDVKVAWSAAGHAERSRAIELALGRR